ncbi:hypothetical protein Clacol_004283 [Clathrus columnatus]|uniref:Uncharacterized protein n=1 Tax=Clathrus columnatus TaxID=1419009 RepID=A0AAV5A8Q0_9AGAM|nr:hypothetical protein Clacol_004283 [Clathrus columnatus]
MGNSSQDVGEETATNQKPPGEQPQEPKDTPLKPFQNIPPEAIDRWLKARIRSKKLCQQFNSLPTPDYFPGITTAYLRATPPERLTILSGQPLFCFQNDINDAKSFYQELFHITPEKAARDLTILPTFWCDYGFNIEFKGQCYFNWNCVILGEKFRRPFNTQSS